MESKNTTINRVLICYKKRQYQEAETLCKKLLHVDRRNLKAWNLFFDIVTDQLQDKKKNSDFIKAKKILHIIYMLNHDLDEHSYEFERDQQFLHFLYQNPQLQSPLDFIRDLRSWNRNRGDFLFILFLLDFFYQKDYFDKLLSVELPSIKCKNTPPSVIPGIYILPPNNLLLCNAKRALFIIMILMFIFLCYLLFLY